MIKSTVRRNARKILSDAANFATCRNQTNRLDSRRSTRNWNGFRERISHNSKRTHTYRLVCISTTPAGDGILLEGKRILSRLACPGAFVAMHYALLSPESSIIVTAAPTTGVDIDVFFPFLFCICVPFARGGKLDCCSFTTLRRSVSSILPPKLIPHQH